MRFLEKENILRTKHPIFSFSISGKLSNFSKIAIIKVVLDQNLYLQNFIKKWPYNRHWKKF